MEILKVFDAILRQFDGVSIDAAISFSDAWTQCAADTLHTSERLRIFERSISSLSRVKQKSSKFRKTKIKHLVIQFFAPLEWSYDVLSMIFGIFGNFRFDIEKIQNKKFHFFMEKINFGKNKKQNRKF